MEKADVAKIPIWAKMINVPLEAWSKEGISALASSLGRPLRMDNGFVKMVRGEQSLLEYWWSLMLIRDLKKIYVCSIEAKKI